MAESRGRGLAALVPNRVNFTKSWQSKVSPRVSAALTQLGKSLGKTISVNSGYRSPSYNKSVGGAKASYHTKGLAADIDMSGWTEAERQKAVADLAAMGVGAFITYTKSPDMLHIDMRPRPEDQGPLFMHDKTARLFDKAPSWFKEVAAAIKPNGIVTPETMEAPKTLAEVQARERAISQAYADPMRALDVVPSRPIDMPARPYSPTPMGNLAAAPVGKVDRMALSALPSPLNAAPAGQVTRAALGPVGAPSSFPARPEVPGSLPAARPTTTVATRPATPAVTGLPAARPSLSTFPARPEVIGALPAAPPDDYAAYEANKAKAFSAMPPPAMPATPLAHPVSVPAVAPPSMPPPAQVLAPVLAPPKVVKDYPVAGIPEVPTAPRATAYDVYNGLADTALDNTGKNTVGRLPDGTTTVTNQWGVTTGMTPYGKQTAVGSLPGIKGPELGNFGSAVKGALPGLAGGALGTAIAGPLGGLLGVALAKAVTQPGGVLSGQVSYPSAFGPITAARPQPGLAFPGAPSGGIRSPTFSNRSRGEMNSISPKAAADISAGRGGLF